MSNYPPGAEYDSNAPYNQVELSDIYEEDAHAFIDDEIKSKDDTFIDWLWDNDYIPNEYTDEDVEQAINDEAICDEYHDYRFNDVVEYLADKEADDRAYYECERYEAEREEYMLENY